jgi:hypothetical protein
MLCWNRVIVVICWCLSLVLAAGIVGCAAAGSASQIGSTASDAKETTDMLEALDNDGVTKDGRTVEAGAGGRLTLSPKNK